MAGCTVKQEFASDSKMATSLGSKTHLEKYIKTQLLCYCATLSFNTSKEQRKKALKVKHNQFNHTPKK